MKANRATLAESLASLGIVKDVPRQPGEFTTQEAAEAADLSRQHMAAMLTAKVKAGLLTARLALENGRRVKLFRPR